MTENKRFTVDENEQGVYAYIKDDDEYVGKRCGKKNVHYVCDLLNKQDQEIQKYRDGFYKAHEMHQDLLKQLSETKKERDEAIFKQKTLEKWYTCPTCAFHNKEFEYLKSLRKK